MGLETVFDRYS